MKTAFLREADVNIKVTLNYDSGNKYRKLTTIEQ